MSIPAWRDHAECRADDPRSWSPPLDMHHALTCAKCPVRKSCADDALTYRDRYTVRAACDLSTDFGREQLRDAAIGSPMTAVLSQLTNRVTVRHG